MAEPTQSVEDAENFLREQTAKYEAQAARLNELLPFLQEAETLLSEYRGRQMLPREHYDAKHLVVQARTGEVVRAADAALDKRNVAVGALDEALKNIRGAKNND